MRVIIEGGDCTGKSLLAALIAKVEGVPVSKTHERGVSSVLGFLQPAPSFEVWDRHWLSEYIYSRGESAITRKRLLPHMVYQFGLAANLHGDLTVVLAVADNLRKALYELSNKDRDYAFVVKSQDWYQKYLHLPLIDAALGNLIKLTCSELSEELQAAAVAEVLDAIGRSREAAPIRREAAAIKHDGWGSLDPGGILILGDVRSQAGAVHAFCNMSTGASSAKFLFDSLIGAELWPSEVYVSNTQNFDGSEVDLLSLFRLLKPAAIICLGANAVKRAQQHSEFKNRLYSVSHPQYMRRFHSKQQKDYIKAFSDIYNASRNH